mmetsp:Transcript_115244/g.336936  ORF Transcript_115244/g.336936 Transcript_115244/m.336936 type:complete len:210 (+) Transcript_115244:894-1523(+)
MAVACPHEGRSCRLAAASLAGHVATGRCAPAVAAALAGGPWRAGRLRRGRLRRWRLEGGSPRLAARLWSSEGSRWAALGSCLRLLVGRHLLLQQRRLIQCQRRWQQWSQRSHWQHLRLQLQLRTLVGYPRLLLPLADWHLQVQQGRDHHLWALSVARPVVGPRVEVGLAALAVTRQCPAPLHHFRPCASSCARCRCPLALSPLPRGPPG